MDKYKDYIARTQQDRISLDALAALEEIHELLRKVLNADPAPVQTIEEEPAKTNRRKSKGDM